MMTAGGIIIWTLMLFILVASQDTVLQGEEAAVCNITVPETQTESVWNCKRCENRFYRAQYWCRGKMCKRTQKTSATSSFEQRCCEGYENKSSVCKPECSPKCEDGHYCAKPNECECNPGWVGQNCTESLWCVVKVNLAPTFRISGFYQAMPHCLLADCDNGQRTTIAIIEQNFSMQVYLQQPDDNLPAKVPYNDNFTKWKRPESLPQCRDQVSNISALVAQSKNMKMYFVPVESSCNIEDDGISENLFEKYKYPLAGTLGIILCAIVILCVTCFLKRKRKAACDAEDIPMKTGATQDYMVENMFYS